MITLRKVFDVAVVSAAMGMIVAICISTADAKAMAGPMKDSPGTEHLTKIEPRVLMATIKVACMDTAGVVANFTKKGFAQKILGINPNGTFVMWTGTADGVERWSLVMNDVKNGLTCKIAGGEVLKK